MIMDEIDFMDNWDIALSQTSTFTDSLPLDNAGLMVPCSQDYTPGWIVDPSQPTYSQNYTVQTDGSQQLTALPSTSTARVSNQSTTVFTNPAELVGFSDQYGSVALSPESIPPGSPNSSTDGDTMPGPDSQEIMDNLDETLVNNLPMFKSDDELDSLLNLLISSQGTEFLSQNVTNGDSLNLALINQVSEGQNSIEVTHGNLIPVAPTSTVTEIQPAVSTKSTERPSNKRKRSEDVLTPSTKKRNQNKEAAKRYREKKKTEAEIHAMEKEELQKEKDELIKKIELAARDRDTVLKLLARNNIPNALINYPDWFTLESD